MKQFFLLILSIFFIGDKASAGKNQKEKISCIPCEDLQKLQLPDVTIIKAVKNVPEIKDGKTPSPSKPHCEVTGRIGTELHFEVLLPEKWNEIFVMGEMADLQESLFIPCVKLLIPVM